MKVSYWIAIVAVALAFTLGYETGQRSTLKEDELIGTNDIATVAELLVNKSSGTDQQSSITATLSSNIPEQSPHDMADTVAEIDNLLTLIDDNPHQKSLVVKLYAILEALSAEDLIALAPLLDNKNETQRVMLSQIIIAQLIEKSPESALAFAQKYNPMPDTPFYLAAIKAQIAEQRPELGFEYLDQLLAMASEDIDLAENAQLIQILAKADLKQLVRALTQFQEKGVKVENGMHALAFGLTTNDEHLNLFNELTQLNDLGVLRSVLFSWMKISPTAVLERLNEIEDSAEREKLNDSAFHSWMYDTPEIAADYYLASASNKLDMLKKIMRKWPNEKAADALIWISKQSDIDTNRYKIDFLKDLSFFDPQFVQLHLGDISLSEDEKLNFYRRLYNGFQHQSSADAEAFLNTLPFKDELFDDAPDKENSTDSRVTIINRVFEKYFDYKHDKAFALAWGNNDEYAYSFAVNKASQSEANQQAIAGCEHYRHKHNVENECKIYAEGDVIMFTLTP